MKYAWQTERSLALEARFRERVIELGGTPAWDAWEGSGKAHRVICREGHESVLVASSPLALMVETETKKALRAAGFRPVHGREYFAAEALGVVEHVAVSYGLGDGFTAGVQLEFPLSAVA